MKAQLGPAQKRLISRRSVTGATVIRFALTGALTMTLIFVAAWAAAQLPYGPTPLFVEIFTYASPATTHALFGGVLVAALTGFVTAAVLAVAYGAFEFIEGLGRSTE